MPDHRRLRGERSRSAIMTATRTLMMNGNWQPSAREIANAAGVSIRMIFLYFKGIENLRLLAIEDADVVDRIESRVLGGLKLDRSFYDVPALVRAVVLGREVVESGVATPE